MPFPMLTPVLASSIVVEELSDNNSPCDRVTSASSRPGGCVFMTRHTHLNFTVGSALALISLSACQTSSPTAEVASPATLPFPATSVPTLTPSPSLPPPTSTTLPPSPKPPLTTGSIVHRNFETGDLTRWQV